MGESTGYQQLPRVRPAKLSPWFYPSDAQEKGKDGCRSGMKEGQRQIRINNDKVSWTLKQMHPEIDWLKFMALQGMMPGLNSYNALRWRISVLTGVAFIWHKGEGSLSFKGVLISQGCFNRNVWLQWIGLSTVSKQGLIQTWCCSSSNQQLC